MFTILTPLLRTGLPSRLLRSSRLLSVPWLAFLELRSCGLTSILCCSTVSSLGQWRIPTGWRGHSGHTSKIYFYISISLYRSGYYSVPWTEPIWVLWSGPSFSSFSPQDLMLSDVPLQNSCTPGFGTQLLLSLICLLPFFFPFLLTSLLAFIGTFTRVLFWPYFFFLYFPFIFPF